MALTTGERLAGLEVEVRQLLEAQKVMGDKIDDLLALRDKGKGALWLAVSLAAAGGVSLFVQLLEWLGFRS